MAPDPELLAKTRQWLVKAGHDLRAADLAHEASPHILGDMSEKAARTTRE